MRRAAFLLPRIVVAALVASAILVMLTGVFLRYVMLPVTDALDLPTVNFFWVEEVGEMLLAWLAMLGAAVGIAERSHFALTIVVHRLPPRWQHRARLLNTAIIAVFGGFLAWQGWKLSLLDIDVGSPALGISQAWLYGSACAGGILIIVYALLAAFADTTQPQAG